MVSQTVMQYPREPARDHGRSAAEGARMVEVFHDDGTALWNFSGEYLVRCPRCHAKAFVHGPRDGRHARFVCERCGLTCDGDSPMHPAAFNVSVMSGPTDVHFGLPVWLQVSCVGHTLWAYNLPHVAFLERLVSADLRLRPRPAPTLYVNKRLASRLPRWMLSAKHRAAVMRGLAELRVLADAESLS
jgi:hypothetical protein